MKLLNIGCGTRFHPDWINLDVMPAHQSVTRCNVLNGIPYSDNYFDVVYHSHVLEHVEKNNAPIFVQECCRVLKPGGIIRIVVPDLEAIVHQYLAALTKAENGEQGWQDNYEWIMLEMYDQVVRKRSGGNMLAYLTGNNLPNREFVVQRGGVEIKNLIERKGETVEAGHEDVRKAGKTTSSFASFIKNPKAYLVKKKEDLIRILLGSDYSVLQAGRFRQQGEIHYWMYDRFSLGKLLREEGFVEPKVESAAESDIPGWVEYHLDAEPDGSAHKPDSLYMEAVKP